MLNKGELKDNFLLVKMLIYFSLTFLQYLNIMEVMMNELENNKYEIWNKQTDLA